MNSLRLALVTATFSLALAACGDSGDASEDAVADSVEMPADEAMADAPMPAADENAAVDVAEPTEEVEPVEEVEGDAQQAAEDAQAAVDDVIAAAEENIETN